MGEEHAQSEQFDNGSSQVEFISPEILGVCGKGGKRVDFVDEKDDKTGRLSVVL